MSKLTRDQVDFIEEYLIRNKVKFWDIRVELLDHIASAIEEKMQNGKTFEEALIEIHVSFGNRYRSKRLNAERTKWLFNESLYADNSGYKKLLLNKQKELNKRLRIRLGKILGKLFTNPLFLIVYLFLGMLLFKQISMSPNTGTIMKFTVFPLLVLSTVPVAWYFMWTFVKRQDSLYLNLLIALPTTTLGLLNIFTFWPKTFITESHALLVYLAIYVLFFPIVIAQIVLFQQERRRFRAYYYKWKRTG